MAPEAGEKLGNGGNGKPSERGRKHLILSIISVVSCVAFAGSGVLIVIGYLNQGSVALGLLGAGVLVFFSTVVFLVTCCIKVNQNHPGRQPQSTTVRVRKSTEETSTPLIKPQPSYSELILPPKAATGPKRQVKSNLQPDQQPSNAKAPQPGDVTTKPATSILTNEKSDLDYNQEKQNTEDKNPNASYSTDINTTATQRNNPLIDVRIVPNPKKAQNHQQKVSTAPNSGNIITASAAAIPANLKEVSHHKQDQDYLMKTPSPPGSIGIPTSSGDLPTDVRIVTHQKQDRHHEEKMSTAPGLGNVTTASAADPPIDVRFVSHHKPDKHHQDKTPAAARSEGVITAPVKECTANEKLVPHHKKAQHPQEKSATAPGLGDVTTASAADPPIEVRFVSHHKPDKHHQDKTLAAARSEGVITAPVKECAANEKRVPHHKKAQHPQEKTAPAPGSGTITSGPVSSITINMKPAFHSKPDQCPQSKIPTAPRSQESTITSVLGPHRNLQLVSHQKQEHHCQTSAQKGPRSVAVTIPTNSNPPNRAGLASHQKNHQHSQDKVPSSRDLTWTPAVDGPSAKPSSHLKQAANPIPHTAACSADIVPALKELSDWKSGLPHRQEQWHQDSKPPAQQSQPSGPEESGSH